MSYSGLPLESVGGKNALFAQPRGATVTAGLHMRPPCETCGRIPPCGHAEVRGVLYSISRLWQRVCCGNKNDTFHEPWLQEPQKVKLKECDIIVRRDSPRVTYERVSGCFSLLQEMSVEKLHSHGDRRHTHTHTQSTRAELNFLKCEHLSVTRRCSNHPSVNSKSSFCPALSLQLHIVSMKR